MERRGFEIEECWGERIRTLIRASGNCNTCDNYLFTYHSAHSLVDYLSKNIKGTNAISTGNYKSSNDIATYFSRKGIMYCDYIMLRVCLCQRIFKRAFLALSK